MTVSCWSCGWKVLCWQGDLVKIRTNRYGQCISHWVVGPDPTR